MSKQRYDNVKASLLQNEKDSLKNNQDSGLFSKEFDSSRNESRILSKTQIEQDKINKDKATVLKTAQKEIDTIQNKLDLENQTKELMKSLLSDYSEYKDVVPFIGESTFNKSQENFNSTMHDLEEEMINFKQDL